METGSNAGIIDDTGIIAKTGELILPFGVVIILGVMIMPIPPILLDLFLSFSITVSLIILLVGLHLQNPLEFSTFPSLLLIVTLFRLSLNVASTRVILLHGDEGITAAGKIIYSFGNFVVGGNFLVGIIAFLILVVINFVVITKGAGRIAEVAARFTLDALPGKQMSIDADLNAGLIDDNEARERRETISREAEYYGSMDGANKFVRGDAIAGIMITGVNIVGGLTIGVFQNGMTFAKAAENYTLLTVGDGLVSQIPALIISTAAGIIVTRAGTKMNMGREISDQLLNNSRVMKIAAIILLGLAIVPGLPFLPFFILAVIVGIAAFLITKEQKESVAKDVAMKQKKAEAEAKPSEKVVHLPPIDILGLEVGYALVPLVDVEQNGEVLDRVKAIRRQLLHDLGIVVPPIHIKDNLQLKQSEYMILLKGNELAKGELVMNKYLAMNPGNVQEGLGGLKTIEPTFGLPAYWINESEKEKALSLGYTVVDPVTVITTHLSEIIKRNAHELLGRQDVQQILDNLKESNPKVVEELVPNILSLGGVMKVLQNLLIERIPIRDILTILETLADWAPVTKDLIMLTEYVRQALARTITGLYQTPHGTIVAMVFEPDVEKDLLDAIQQTDQGTFFAMDPGASQRIMNAVIDKIGVFASSQLQPLVLCSPVLRYHFKKFADRFIPDLVVLSYNDILNDVKIETFATIGYLNAD